MIKIGLTGGIGTGKSTISKIISETGISIVDCDIIAREILDVNYVITLRIKQEMGKEFIDKDGNLIRKKLGNYIFENPEKKKQYEDIILPYIMEDILYEISILESDNVDICIVDAPTLIETGLYQKMDQNILVWVDTDTQIKRVMERDAFTRQQIIDRINSQMSIEDKLKYANYTIDNANTLDSTRNQVFEIIKKIKNCYNIK